MSSGETVVASELIGALRNIAATAPIHSFDATTLMRAAALLEHVATALDLDGEADAVDNLEGALQSLRHDGASKVCIETVERVQRQITTVLRPYMSK